MDELRERMLDVATDELYETGVSSCVAHVRLSNIARRAGYSASAAYRCWPSQADFHRDLAIRALTRRDRHPIADTTRTIKEPVSRRRPLSEVLRLGGNHSARRDYTDLASYTALAIRASGGWDTDIRDAAWARVAEGLALHTELYGALLATYDREMVEPFTVEHLAMSIAALADGFAVQDLSRTHHPTIERTDVDPDVGSEWTLLASLVEIVVDAMTSTARVTTTSTKSGQEI